MNSAQVFLHERMAGVLEQENATYRFTYSKSYLALPDAEAIAIAMPLQEEAFTSEQILIPFFDNLIPEGYLLQLALETLDLNYNDRFAILLATTQDCIGAVSIKPIP